MAKSISFIVTVLFIFSIPIFIEEAISNNEESITETKFEDLCPSLPKEISNLRPKYRDFVTVKPSVSRKKWELQDKKFIEAKKEFQSKFASEIQELELEWEEFKKKQFTSQKNFYSLFITHSNDNDLLNKVKINCWINVMGTNEFWKDHFCHPTENPPSEMQWDNIFSCTVENAKILEIYESKKP